jgi:hypothetical protein
MQIELLLQDLQRTVEGLRAQLQQEADRLASCITISWSWELALLLALLVLFLDRLIRPLWVRYTGRPYFLDA